MCTHTHTHTHTQHTTHTLDMYAHMHTHACTHTHTHYRYVHIYEHKHAHLRCTKYANLHIYIRFICNCIKYYSYTYVHLCTVLKFIITTVPVEFNTLGTRKNYSHIQNVRTYVLMSKLHCITMVQDGDVMPCSLNWDILLHVMELSGAHCTQFNDNARKTSE